MIFSPRRVGIGWSAGRLWVQIWSLLERVDSKACGGSLWWAPGTRQFCTGGLAPLVLVDLKVPVRIFLLTQTPLWWLRWRLIATYSPFREKLTIIFIIPLMTRLHGKTTYRRQYRHSCQNRQWKYCSTTKAFDYTIRCSGNEPALLLEKEEKQVTSGEMEPTKGWHFLSWKTKCYCHVSKKKNRHYAWFPNTNIPTISGHVGSRLIFPCE